MVVCVPLSVITYKHDEAKRYLTFLSGLSRIPFVLWKVTFVVWHWNARLVDYLWGEWTISVDAYVERQRDRSFFDTTYDFADVPFFASIIIYPAVVLCFLLALLLIVLWFPMLLIPFLLRGHAAGFGEGLTRSLWVNISVSLMPKIQSDDKTRVIELSMAQIEDDRRGWKKLIPRLLFLHTLVYRDPVAIRHILAVLAETHVANKD